MKTELLKFNTLYKKIITECNIILENNEKNMYIVQKGDTLSKIASLYKNNNITVDKIAKANNIDDINKISIGQKLVIPGITEVSQDISKTENSQQNTSNDVKELKELLGNLSKEDQKKVLFIARVLYSETGTKTTEEEVLKVATVIYNRPKTKQAFPYAKDIYATVNDKAQFSCINDKNNSNWWEFRPDLNERTKNAVKIAYQLYTNTFTPIDEGKKFNQKYYMYIDHSLKKTPDKFYSKKYWNLAVLPETEHFKFYSLSPKKA